MTGTGVAAVRSAEGRIHLSNFITALLAKVLCAIGVLILLVQQMVTLVKAI